MKNQKKSRTRVNGDDAVARPRAPDKGVPVLLRGARCASGTLRQPALFLC